MDHQTFIPILKVSDVLVVSDWPSRYQCTYGGGDSRHFCVLANEITCYRFITTLTRAVWRWFGRGMENDRNESSEDFPRDLDAPVAPIFQQEVIPVPWLNLTHI